MDFLKSMELVLVEENGKEDISWKQGSFCGVGGNKKQTYKLCIYKVSRKNKNILVYIEKDCKTPEQMCVDAKLQYGMNNGILFLVYHNKRQMPNQDRFMSRPAEETVENSRQLQKHFTKYDSSWIPRDYLRNIK